MRKTYLTKNRLKALNTALSLDAVLYEKYRRVMENIRKAENKLDKKGNVLRVVRRSNGIEYIERIVDIHTTPDGQVVFID